LIKGGQVEVKAEEVEEVVGVDLSVGVPKKYEEPESCGSPADFLLGVEMEIDPPGREEVEVDVLMAVETDLLFNHNDSTKCQSSYPATSASTALAVNLLASTLPYCCILAIALSLATLVSPCPCPCPKIHPQSTPYLNRHNTVREYSYNTPYLQDCTEKKMVLKIFLSWRFLQCSPYPCPCPCPCPWHLSALVSPCPCPCPKIHPRSAQA
jgi:hypothetical protein